MEPAQRIFLALRVPPIRKIEKEVPLKIDELHISEHVYMINGTHCKFETSEKGNPKFKVNWKPQEVNSHAAEQHNLDRDVTLPGDVRLARKSDKDDCPDGPRWDIKKRLWQLIHTRKRLIILNKIAKNANMGQMEEEASEEEKSREHKKRVDKLNRMSIIELEELLKKGVGQAEAVNEVIHTHWKYVEHLELLLRPVRNQRNNTQPDIFMRFTMGGANHIDFSEIVEYGQKKMYDAEKSFWTFFLGNRTHPVYIKTLGVRQNHVLRFPGGVKFQIRMLNCDGDVRKGIHVLQKIIDQSSYPLEALTLWFRTQEQDWNHKSIKSARKLIFNDPIQTGTAYPFYLKLANKRVHAANVNYLSGEEYVGLIKSWIEDQKPIDTCYTFIIDKPEELRDTMSLIRKKVPGAAFKNVTIEIPMNDYSHIVVSFEMSSEEHLKFVLKICVEPTQGTSGTTVKDVNESLKKLNLCTK